MFRCSSSSSVCLATFLVEAAAVASVQTLFRENPIAGLLGRNRRHAGLLFSSALHRPRLSPPGEEGEGGGTHCGTVYSEGANHTQAANYYTFPTLSYAFPDFLLA